MYMDIMHANQRITYRLHDNLSKRSFEDVYTNYASFDKFCNKVYNVSIKIQNYTMCGVRGKKFINNMKKIFIYKNQTTFHIFARP